MKTHQPRQRGSFGIPPEAQEAAKTFQDKKTAADMEDDDEGLGASDESEEEESEHTLPPPEPPKTYPSETVNDLTKLKPRAALKAVGIELSDSDFQSIIYRGYVEKEVELVPSVGGIKAMTVKLKTLTPEEFNLADELVAEDLETIKGTNAGFQIRRELWNVAFAAIEINGREIAKVKREKDADPDLKELARSRHKILQQLSPGVINKLIKTVTIMGWAISSIVEDPKSNF
jgi:hypothetical protein